MFDRYVKERPIVSMAGMNGGLASYILYSSAETGSYEIARSLRFSSSESTYLTRDEVDGDHKKFTFAFWIKKLGTQYEWPTIISSTSSSNNRTDIRWNVDRLQIYSLVGGNYGIGLITTRKFRDYSSWYHVVISVDTTQSTASDRAKIYINGVQETAFDGTDHYPSQNFDCHINRSGNTLNIGRRSDNGSNYIDAYLADVHFLDGTAASASDFGESDSNGVWQPKSFSGSYGNNGYHLKGSDTSTNAALGFDTSSTSNTTENGQYFKVVTYQGTGGDQTINVGFEPGMVWIKSRNHATWHQMNDNVRGAGWRLYVNETSAQDYSVDNLTGFNDQGFTLGADSNASGVNVSGKTYVAWCWKANSRAVSNRDGTIQSQVSANQAKGFSIAEYTGVGGSNNNFGHGLGSVPKFVIIKCTSNTDKWIVYHESIGTDYLTLNDNVAKASDSTIFSTAATSSVFTLGGSSSFVNFGNRKYIAYCWSEVSGFSKFGSYSGSGSAGQQITGLGFKPRFLMIKNTTSAENWVIMDSARNDQLLFANTNSTESASDVVDFTDDGFTLKQTGSASNASGQTYVYVAYAGDIGNHFNVHNLQASTGDTTPTQNFKPVLYSGNGGTQTITTGFSPDLVWIKARNTGTDHALFDTVRGVSKFLQPSQTDAESTQNGVSAFQSTGFDLGSWNVTNSGSYNFVAWAWNAGANSNKTYSVKVVSDSGNKYRFDGFGQSAVTLQLSEGSTYVFDQSDSSNSNHPLRFSTTSNGTHGGGSEYTTGVTVTGTPGQAGAKTTIVVAASAPTLYYYCTQHSGMGGQANTNSTSGSSNFDGSIHSVVKVNQEKGFSIVSYTGNNTSNSSFGHGLGKRPAFVLIKRRENNASGQSYWGVYHQSVGATKVLWLNLTDAAYTSSSPFNNKEPDSGKFILGSDPPVNPAGDDMIAYCWSEVSGFSKFGKYSGTGSDQTITCGFRPAFVMIKSDSTAGEEWMIYDSARNTTNPRNNFLRANQSNAEGTYQQRYVDFDDNGFSFPGSSGLEPINQNGRTYIYMAFAENDNGEDLSALFDSPEQRAEQEDDGSGGNIVSNFATLNPNSNSGLTLSNGGLEWNGGTSQRYARSTILASSGKWYCEFTMRSTNHIPGIIGSDHPDGAGTLGEGSSSRFQNNGTIGYSGGDPVTGGLTWTGGDIVQLYMDMDNKAIYWGVNGTLKVGDDGNTGVPTSGASKTGAAIYGGMPSLTDRISLGSWGPGVSTYGDTSINSSINFGARPFVYSAPSGYKAWCTANLPTPTIEDGTTNFETTLYNGNGANPQTITGINHGPDLVWYKHRSSGSSNGLFDTMRGVNKYLTSNSNNAEQTVSGVTAFTSDGFSLGTDTGANGNGTWVAWTWEGGDLVANSSYDQSKTWSGQMTSTGNGIESANPATSLFNGVTSGLGMRVNGSSSATWTPVGGYAFTSSVIIYCAGDGKVSGTQFTCVHAGGTLDFTSSVTSGTTNTAVNLTDLGITSPITNITITSGNNNPRASAIVIDSKTLVDAGLIPVGSLNSDSYNTAGWVSNTTVSNLNSSVNMNSLFDGTYSGYVDGTQGSTLTLGWSSGAISGRVRVLAKKNGNSSNMQYVDHNNPSVAPTVVMGTDSVAQWWDLGNIDLKNLYAPHVSSGNAVIIYAIELDGKMLVDSGQTPPDLPSIPTTVRANPTAGFSIATYEGNGVSQSSVAHGLNTQPKWFIVKRRNSSEDWFTNHFFHSSNATTPGSFIKLNMSEQGGTNSGVFANTDPTSTVNYLGTNGGVNGDGSDYVMYSFAPVEGYSAMGKYTGTGNADGPFIHTGFKVGWVLVKNTTTNGEPWTIFDSTRDEHNVATKRLRPDSSGAEESASARDKDLLSNGFKVRGNSGEQNSDGDNYIYVAFAERPFGSSRAR